jgi:hypothetical protein
MLPGLNITQKDVESTVGQLLLQVQARERQLEAALARVAELEAQREQNEPPRDAG